MHDEILKCAATFIIALLILAAVAFGIGVTVELLGG